MARLPNSLHSLPFILSPQGRRFSSPIEAVHHLLYPPEDQDTREVMPEGVKTTIKKNLSKKQSRTSLRKKALLMNAKRAREELEKATRGKVMEECWDLLHLPIEMLVQELEPIVTQESYMDEDCNKDIK